MICLVESSKQKFVPPKGANLIETDGYSPEQYDMMVSISGSRQGSYLIVSLGKTYEYYAAIEVSNRKHSPFRPYFTNSNKLTAC